MVKLSDQIGRVLLVTSVLITNPFFALLGDDTLAEKKLFDIMLMIKLCTAIIILARNLV